MRFDLSSLWTGQADVDFEHITTGSNPEEHDEPYSVANVALHCSQIAPNHLIGGFISVGVDGGWWDNSFHIMGVEAKLFIGKTMVYGQLGTTSSLTDDLVDATYARFQAQHFLTDNTTVSANLGLVDIQRDGDDKIDTAVSERMLVEADALQTL